MEKIIFVLIHADLGGIEKSFINLVNELVNTQKYKIDIFLFTHRGPLMDEIPEQCYIYPEDKYLHLVGTSQKDAWEEGFFEGNIRIILGGITKFISRKVGYALTMHNIKKLSGYDVAISYMHGKTKSFYGGTNEFVLNKVDAKRKYTFIHGDLINANLINPYNYRMYKKFDKIVSVSESCKRLFDQTWQDLSYKSMVIENGCNVEHILNEAGEGINYNRDRINIVTVARLSAVKGIQRAIKVFLKLKTEQLIFRWHIVGGGEEELYICKMISDYNLKEDIILYGSQNNPYQYMKNADAFLLPSFQEAAPVVFQEANCLGVPILTTETLSAIEMVQEKGIGYVCDNSEEGLYQLLKKVLKNPHILDEIRKKMTRKKNNDIMLQQFEELIGSD